MDFEIKFDLRAPDYQPSPELLRSTLAGFGFSENTKIRLLTGGYSNTNFEISEPGGDRFVLRCSDKSERVFEAEIAIMARLKNEIPTPKVIASQTNHADLDRHVAILQFLPGNTLSLVEDQMTALEIAAIGEQLGHILATIHAFTFEKSGFLGSGFKVAEPFESFHAGYFGYMRQCAEDPLVSRHLQPNERQDLKDFIAKNSRAVAELSAVSSLVHADFNQKNILVSNRSGRWLVTGILDWEFSFSGSPLIDFGNFFRFETEMPVNYQAAFIRSYRECGGRLPENWRHLAKVLDLLSLLQFLMRAGDHPKTHATAKSVIRSILHGE